MRIWFALIVVPILALTDQTVAFALVGRACARQSTALLHASHTFFLTVAVAGAIGAALQWRATAAPAASHEEGARQLHFLAGVAMTVAALSALAIAAMWIPTWLISSCVA
jgi:hypothetical protein